MRNLGLCAGDRCGLEGKGSGRKRQSQLVRKSSGNQARLGLQGLAARCGPGRRARDQVNPEHDFVFSSEVLQYLRGEVGKGVGHIVKIRHNVWLIDFGTFALCRIAL